MTRDEDGIDGPCCLECGAGRNGVLNLTPNSKWLCHNCFDEMEHARSEWEYWRRYHDESRS